MSDQVNGQEPQGAYPPPPEQGAAPPPPPPGLFPGTPAPPLGPAPAVAHSPAAATPEERPKKRTGLIVAVIVAVLLCGLGSCVAAVIGFGVLGGDDTETVQQSESHYSAAMDAVEKADASLGGLDDAEAGGEKVDQALATATKELRTARDEIAAARASIEQLEDSPGKKDYLASLEQATKALDGLEDLLAYMGTASGMMGVVEDAGATAQKANSNLNAAISAGNRSKYSAMKDKAKAASSGFAKAALLFDQAHKLDESAGLDEAAVYVRKRGQEADVVIVMASDGKAGRVSAYNKGIKKMNKLRTEADKLGEPAIVSDPNWAQNRLEELNTAIETAAEQADELRAKALGAMGYKQ